MILTLIFKIKGQNFANFGEKVVPDYTEASACATTLTTGDIYRNFRGQGSYKAI